MNLYTFIYQGRVISVNPNLISSNGLIAFLIDNSMVIAKDPSLKGEIAVNRSMGMQFEQTQGYQPNILRTEIMRDVISNPLYRDSLIDYISRFVDVSDKSIIFSAIGKDSKDIDVTENLSKLPRKLIRADERISSRVHLVLNILLKVAHTPITSYLDIGTGDGTIANEIGKRLDVEDVQGTDVFPMLRPIPTLIMKLEDRLPESWNGRFLLITAFSVLHHVKNQLLMIEDMYRVLAPGGILIIREHDYLDLQFAWDQDLNPKLLSIAERPFRLFLDAIHIASMAFTDEPAFWALYRARREWDTLFMKLGMMYMYSNMRDIERNPQRLYESVYMKRPSNDTQLILEWRDTRSLRLDAFFPKLKGLDILDRIKEGVNYNEEILAYMTPWKKAIETSQLISKTIKALYPKLGRFKLVDGTGGAGGNDIAFSLNRDISILLIYERVPLFYNFIVNNLQLYTGLKALPAKFGQGLYIYNAGQLIYINNSTPNLLKHRKNYYKDTVVFLDVPWEHEGSGYKLSGYKYEDSTLEELSLKLLLMEALLVVMKLPPDYLLNIPHNSVLMAKETVYLISESSIPVKTPIPVSTKSPSGSIPGGNLVHEIVRYVLMELLKQLFISLFPEKKLSMYYRWVYEQIGYQDARDPIIPATIEYRPSKFLQQGIDVPLTRVELIKLIKEKYPDLVPQTRFPPGNLAALLNLILLVTARSSVENPANRQLFVIANQLKDQFDEIIKAPGLDANVLIRLNLITITPNNSLLNILGSNMVKVPILLLISELKVLELLRRYRGSSFDRDLGAMLLRYSDVMDDRNANLHAALPAAVFATLSQSSLSVDIEGFASPLNATLDKYFSAFPDTDLAFGSIGNFLKFTGKMEGSYELNPPFTEEVMELMVVHIEELMNNGSYSFVVIVPNWTSFHAIELMKGSKYLKWLTVLPMGSHSYIVGDQHRQFKLIDFRIETAIFILQSELGSKDYPIPTDLRNNILVSFS